MIDERERFERAFELFEMPEPALERLVGRRDRKRRNEQIAAAGVAFAILLAAGAIFGRAWFASEPVPADPPKPEPEEWVRFTYGYSIDVPARWTHEPAIVPWRWGEGSREDGRADVWYSPTVFLQIASQPMPADVTEDEWFDHGEFRRWVDAGVACDVRSSTPFEVDGVPATLTQTCHADARGSQWNDALEVALVTDGRGYSIWFQSSGDFEDQRSLFERILATMNLRPDDAADVSDAGGWMGIWPHHAGRRGGRAGERRRGGPLGDVAARPRRGRRGGGRPTVPP